MDLVSRLKIYMETNGISSSIFADTCNIPRPTMSQILNGRNKKISDELICKIHSAYPDLSVLWLMFGEGEMTLFSNTQISEAKKNLFTEDERPHIAENKQDINSAQAFIDDLEFISSDESDENSNFTINSQHNENGNSVSSVDNTTTIYPKTKPSTKTMFDRTNNFIEFNTHPLDSGISNGNRSKFPIDNGNSNDGSKSQPQLFDNNENNNKHNTNVKPLVSDDIEGSTTPSAQRDIQISTVSGKRITNIVVFYSDNSFQSFYPGAL